MSAVLKNEVLAVLRSLAAVPERTYAFYDPDQFVSVCATAAGFPPRSTRAALAELTLSGEVERDGRGGVRARARLLYAEGVPVAPVVHDEPDDDRPVEVACPLCGARHAADAALGEMVAPCGGLVYAKGLTRSEAAAVLDVEADDLTLKPVEVAQVLAFRRRS